ncbi:MAG: hypothetical protein FWC04_08555 [Chitinispirillia bacterium]|nr:hypothetical protein [Chitinispirillia bacterium]
MERPPLSGCFCTGVDVVVEEEVEDDGDGAPTGDRFFSELPWNIGGSGRGAGSARPERCAGRGRSSTDTGGLPPPPPP